MKKQDILRIIELNQKRKKNQNLISLTKHEQFSRIDLDEKYWFPDIPDLEKEFSTLKQEIKKALQENKTNLEELNQLTKECHHPVRLQANSFMISTSTCVFCQKNIYGDNTSNGNTIYNDINRNRQCVMFTKDRYDENYEDYIEGYTLEEVYEIILRILETKTDDEEIDFIKEIKQLQLDKCHVDERPFEKEYYVLIIGGSNQETINASSFLSNTKINTSMHLAKYLGGLPKVKVELLENPETYHSNEFKKIFPYTNICGYRFFEYTTIKELQDKIHHEQDVPFDLIINTSNLQEFIIDNNQISTKEHSLNLKALFPNSIIIDISNYHSKDEKALLSYLKQKLTGYNECYSYQSEDQFYHLNQDNLEPKTLSETAKSIEKTLIKK